MLHAGLPSGAFANQCHSPEPCCSSGSIWSSGAASARALYSCGSTARLCGKRLLGDLLRAPRRAMTKEIGFTIDLPRSTVR